MRYSFTAVSPAGERVRRTEPADDADTLRSRLTSEGWVVLRVEPAGADARPQSARRSVLEATQAMASLLGAGLPLSRSLQVAQGIVPGDVATVLGAVLGDVRKGMHLADALARHGEVFPPLYVGTVRAGERTGDLAGAFDRLAARLERDEELRQRILSAALYPTVVAIGSLAAVMVLLVVALPSFAKLLGDAGTALPRSTAFLLGLGAWFEHGWPILLMAALVTAGGVAVVLRTEGGQRAIAQLILRIPLIGTVRRLFVSARFARTLGVLLDGGAPALVALRDTADSVADPLAREEALRIRGRVREGSSIRAALAEGHLFDPALTQMVGVGEESAQLGAFLQKAADVAEQRAERTLRRLVGFLEPVMIILLGVVVGFVALSLLQAIYSVNADAFR